MATTTGLGLIVTMALLLGCIGGGPIVVAPGVTVKLICTGPDVAWYLNGRQAFTNEDCYKLALRSAGDRNATATLAINANRTCDAFNVYCRIYSKSQFLYIHNTTLIVQGHLPSPESVHVGELINSSTIQWKPPYSSLNSDIIHVNPHITQYTLYITDNYTGNSIVNVNVTETQFIFNAPENDLCPMYQVSAWNAGGEGELSETVQERIPQKIATGNVVTYIASQVLHIILQVTEPCKTRTPEYFIITVMNSGRTVKTTTVEYDHQLQSQLAITIELNVNMCSLHVNISAGNGAGMSLPTEIEVECPSIYNNSDSTPTTSSETNTITSDSVVTDTAQREQDSIIVPLSVGVSIAVLVIMAAVGVAAFVAFAFWRGSRKEKRTEEKVNTTSPAAAQTVSSGTVYADVEPLQRKIKPPSEDDIVQYQTVFPQPVIADPIPPTLPPKISSAGAVPSDTVPPDEALNVPALNEEFSGGEEEGPGNDL